MSVIQLETGKLIGFDKEGLIDSRIRLSAANKGALPVLGRSPIIALNLGQHNQWMSFLVVKILDDWDQFNLGMDFIRNFDVAIDLNNAMLLIPVKLIMRKESEATFSLSRRVNLKANEAAIVSLRMKIYNKLNVNKQVCIVTNPNSQSAAFVGKIIFDYQE